MEKAMGALDITDPNYSSNYDEKKPPADGAPAEDGSDSEDEGDMSTSVLLDSVTKDEWKSIEASLSHHKKTVAEMLKRACSQVRTKGELILDESNGKFLGDMLPEMETFSTWCYKVRAAAPPAALAAALPARAPARRLAVLALCAAGPRAPEAGGAAGEGRGGARGG